MVSCSIQVPCEENVMIIDVMVPESVLQDGAAGRRSIVQDQPVEIAFLTNQRHECKHLILLRTGFNQISLFSQNSVLFPRNYDRTGTAVLSSAKCLLLT